MHHLTHSFKDSFKQYIENITVAIAFLILLVFVLLFLQFENVFISSGNLFAAYDFSSILSVGFIVEVALLIIFLIFYSIFVSLMIFGVRKNLSHVRLHYYLTERIQKFGLRVFAFYFVFVIFLWILGTLLVLVSIPIIWGNALLLIASIFFLFVPQSIVVDESSLRNAVMHNFEFIKRSPASFLVVVVTSIVLLAIVPLIGFVFDFFYFVGSFVSLVIVLVFVVPFIEALKTELYMKKFELIKQLHKTGYR